MSDISRAQHTTALRRELGLLDLLMVSLGSIVGAGWLFSAGRAAAFAGPSSLISWVIGGVAALSIALIYSELASHLPEAGGAVRYPHYSHGNLVGFTIGWALWVSYAAVPAAEAKEVITYANDHLPYLDHHEALQVLFEVSLIVVFVIINAVGIRFFAKITTVFTLFKLAILPLTIIALLVVAKHWHNLTQFGGFAPKGINGIFGATSAAGVVFSYAGFREPVEMGGEARHPCRDIPLAVVGGIAISAVLYLLLQLAYLVSVSPQVLSHGGWSHALFDFPLAQAATFAGLLWLGQVLAVASVFSPAVTGNIYTGVSSRVLYALARNRYLPSWLARVATRTAIPFLALAVSSTLAVIYLPLTSLIGVITGGTVLTYMSGPVSAAVIRRRRNVNPDAFRVPGFRFVGPFAFVVGTLLIYWNGWSNDWKILVIILGGVLLFVVSSTWFWPNLTIRLTKRDVRCGAWLIAYFVVLLGLSLFGSGEFGSPLRHHLGILRFPWDLTTVSLVGLAFYYLGAHSGLPESEQRDVSEAETAAWKVGS